MENLERLAQQLLQNQQENGLRATIGRGGGKIQNFNGSHNPSEIKGFLAAMELQMNIHRITTDDDRVMFFGTYLTGPAAIWFHEVTMGMFAQLRYEDLVAHFKRRYLPVNHIEHARERLETLKQTGPVSRYINQFIELAAQMVDPPYNHAQYQLDRFKAGLKREIRVQLALTKPQTMQEAYEAAQELDDLTWKNRADSYVRRPGSGGFRPNMNYRKPEPNYFPQRERDPDAMDIDEIRQSHNNGRPARTFGGRPNTRRPIKCFNCKGEGHIARNCTHPRVEQGNYRA